jgi:hypothetical protein
LNCVCRCRNGFLSAESPPIHIFDGEKVCIHRIRPPTIRRVVSFETKGANFLRSRDRWLEQVLTAAAGCR